jgi:hypothetical protein
MTFSSFSSPSYTTMPSQRKQKKRVLASANFVWLNFFLFFKLLIEVHANEALWNSSGSQRGRIIIYEWVNLMGPSTHFHCITFCDENLPSFAVSTLVSSDFKESTPHGRTLYIPPCHVEPKRHWLAWATIDLVRWAESRGWHDASWTSLDVWSCMNEWSRWIIFIQSPCWQLFYFIG